MVNRIRLDSLQNVVAIRYPENELRAEPGWQCGINPGGRLQRIDRHVCAGGSATLRAGCFAALRLPSSQLLGQSLFQSVSSVCM